MRRRPRGLALASGWLGLSSCVRRAAESRRRPSERAASPRSAPPKMALSTFCAYVAPSSARQHAALTSRRCSYGAERPHIDATVPEAGYLRLSSAPLQQPNRRATAATRRWRPARTFDQSAAAAKDLIEAGELGPACHKAERFGPATPWLSHAMPDHGSIARPRRLLARGSPLNLLDVLALRCSAAAIRRRQHRPASQLHLIALCAHCRRDLFRTTGADQLVRAVDGLLWPQRLRDEDRRRSMAIYHLLALAAAPAVVLGARHASGRRVGSARHLGFSSYGRWPGRKVSAALYRCCMDGCMHASRIG